MGGQYQNGEDNIRMDLEQIGINAGNWVDSAQDRNLLESPCECSIEPTGSISHGVRVSQLVNDICRNLQII